MPTLHSNIRIATNAILNIIGVARGCRCTPQAYDSNGYCPDKCTVDLLVVCWIFFSYSESAASRDKSKLFISLPRPITQSRATIIIFSAVLLAAAEVPQLHRLVIRPRHNDAVTELQTRHPVGVITQRHESLTSCQAPYLQHITNLNQFLNDVVNFVYFNDIFVNTNENMNRNYYLHTPKPK